MKKDPKVFLLHIRDFINDIERHLQGCVKEDFLSDGMIQDAVVRKAEIIGEAVNNLDAKFKNRYPDIPWPKIAAMRNVLIHEYFGVDLNLIWDVIQKDLPKLKEDIKRILNDLE